MRSQFYSTTVDDDSCIITVCTHLLLLSLCFCSCYCCKRCAIEQISAYCAVLRLHYGLRYTNFFSLVAIRMNVWIQEHFFFFNSFSCSSSAHSLFVSFTTSSSSFCFKALTCCFILFLRLNNLHIPQYTYFSLLVSSTGRKEALKITTKDNNTEKSEWTSGSGSGGRYAVTQTHCFVRSSSLSFLRSQEHWGGFRDRERETRRTGGMWTVLLKKTKTSQSRQSFWM